MNFFIKSEYKITPSILKLGTLSKSTTDLRNLLSFAIFDTSFTVLDDVKIILGFDKFKECFNSSKTKIIKITKTFEI